MIVNSCFLLIGVWLLTLIEQSLCQHYVGDFCTVQNTGAAGECKLLGNCPSAITALQNQGIFPQTCGFEGTQAIVCCPGGGGRPNTPPTPTRATTRTTRRTNPPTRATVPTPASTTTRRSGPLRVGDRSKEKCAEYGKYVYVKESNVALIPGAGEYQRADCAVVEVPLIVGGEKAKPKEFPHMALIGFDDENNQVKWQCGGSLISERFVLTAGHCLIDKQYGDSKYVRLGEYILNTNNDDAKVQDFTIAERIKHPDYRPPSQYNDIALLKLNSNAVLNNYVRPACLNTQRALTSEAAVASGWGKVGYTSDTSDVLLKVVLEYFSHAECNNSYRSNIGIRLRNGIVDESQVCAGSHDDAKDTCQGDSGGPLQIFNSKEVYCTYKIIGVTSFGKSCGANIAGVYTRVSNYIEWIEGIVWS